MVRQYILKMGMPIVTNGYVLVEMLLVMMLTSVMTVLYLPRSRDINCDDYIFINDYFKKLSISMISNEKTYPDDSRIENKYPIYFSNNGNINQAQTIKGNRHQIILHLGNGYLTYE